MIDAGALSHRPPLRWPFFETTVASLISPGFNVLDFGKVDLTGPISRFQWDSAKTAFVPVPLPPIHFEGRVRSATQLVTQATYKNCFKVGVLGAFQFLRMPPVVPDAFAEQVADLRFTNHADVASVLELQRRVATAVLESTTKLQFDTSARARALMPAGCRPLDAARWMPFCHG